MSASKCKLHVTVYLQPWGFSARLSERCAVEARPSLLFRKPTRQVSSISIWLKIEECSRLNSDGVSGGGVRPARSSYGQGGSLPAVPFLL